MKPEITRKDRRDGGITIDINVGEHSFELQACLQNDGTYALFGFYYGPEDEDNLPGYRQDGLDGAAVEKAVERFVAEYGNEG